MAPRSADGKWVEHFDPKLGGGQGGRAYFTEVNSWLYTFSVQQDVAGISQPANAAYLGAVAGATTAQRAVLPSSLQI